MSHEASPLWPPGQQISNAKLLLLGASVVSMVCFSVGLIYFNSYMMKPDHFPHAVPLMICHMGMSAVFSALLYLVKPSLFSSLTDPDKKVVVNADLLLRGCLPIALVFTIGLVLGNMAYSYLGVAFIQMLKETNIVWVYLIAVAVGLERLTFQAVEVIVLATLALTMTVHGESHFTLVGFLIQSAAVFFEAARINLQTIMLSKKGKLDPLSYVLLVSPLCCLLLLTALFGIHASGAQVHGLTLPAFAKLQEWAPLLFLSSCVAFGLNVSIAVVITKVSSMGYVFCQLTKDVCAVLIGVTFAGEVVTVLQYVAFTLQIFAAYAWALLKMFPERMSDGVMVGIVRLHLGLGESLACQSDLETAKSVEKKAKPLQKPT